MRIKRSRGARILPIDTALRAYSGNRIVWFFIILSVTGWEMAIAARPAAAIFVNINSSALNGMAGRLDFQLLDGDLTANNSATIASINTNGVLQGNDCSVGCTGGPPFVINDALGLGQFIQDLVLSTVLSINLAVTNQFAGGDADLLVLNLLDPATNFSLIDTNLDQLAGPLPFQDALFVYNFATGQFATASVSTPLLPITTITTVDEPSNWLLMIAGGALLMCARTLRWMHV